VPHVAADGRLKRFWRFRRFQAAQSSYRKQSILQVWIHFLKA
jgi:hypothetical protein